MRVGNRHSLVHCDSASESVYATRDDSITLLVISLHLEYAELEHQRQVFGQPDVRGLLFTGPLAAAAIIPTSIVTSLVASTVMVKQLPIEGERPRI